jgi:hypothetical protein
MITGNASRGPEAACGLDLSGVLCPTRYAAIITREDMLNPGRPGWIPRPGDLRPVTLDASGGLHAGERLAASARAGDGRRVYWLADLPDGIYAASTVSHGRSVGVCLGIRGHRLAWWTDERAEVLERLMGIATHLTPVVTAMLYQYAGTAGLLAGRGRIRRGGAPDLSSGARRGATGPTACLDQQPERDP